MRMLIFHVILFILSPSIIGLFAILAGLDLIDYIVDSVFATLEGGVR